MISPYSSMKDHLPTPFFIGTKSIKSDIKHLHEIFCPDEICSTDNNEVTVYCILPINPLGDFEIEKSICFLRPPLSIFIIVYIQSNGMINLKMFFFLSFISYSSWWILFFGVDDNFECWKSIGSTKFSASKTNLDRQNFIFCAYQPVKEEGRLLGGGLPFRGIR